MTSKKITIIMPFFNVEHFIKKSIDSIVKQSYENIEIILINDCSPANEESILWNYIKTDKRIKYFKNEKNIGLGASRNIGISEATGDYVLFVDADDYIKPDLCKKIANVIKQYDNPDIIEFKFATCDENGENIRIADWLPNYKTGFVPLEKYWMLYATSVWCRAFRLNFIKQNNLLNSINRGAEDIPFTQAAFRIAKSFVYLNYVGYVWRTRNLSLSRIKRSAEQQKERFLPILQELKQNLIRHKVFNQTDYDLQCINILIWNIYDSGFAWYNYVRNFYKKFNYNENDFLNYNCKNLYSMYKKVRQRPYWLYILKKYFK